ncbi:MAG TPA: cell division protein FtsQ [Cyclobacteriaceae bacterium]
MAWLKINVRREAKIIVGLLLVGALIAFSERKHDVVTIRDVHIRMQNIGDNHFMDEGDITKLMETDMEALRGADVKSIDLNEIEKRIRQDRYVKEAELYNDLRGNLVVNVRLRRPLARIVRNDGPDGYIAEDGTIMPASDKFTSRTTLISGARASALLQADNIAESEDGQALLELLRYIHDDEFWNAQVAQLDIDSKGRICMYPQVGGERIEFGRPENLERKFAKLRIYYKEILPRTGWNKYGRVNLEYEGQIVAERNPGQE